MENSIRKTLGQTIGNNILLLLQRNEIGLPKCRGQACDGHLQ